MALNVLVVDDSAVMRAMIIKSLRLSGVALCKIHEAANGQEALQVLGQNWVDLALVDINMPVMTGEEMLDQVRRNPETADLPIIIVSTEGSKARIAMLQQKGVKFIHKPFMPEILREAIIEVTGVTDEQSIGESPIQSSGPDF